MSSSSAAASKDISTKNISRPIILAEELSVSLLEDQYACEAYVVEDAVEKTDVKKPTTTHEDENDASPSWQDNCLGFFFFVLLFLQFGIVFSLEQPSSTEALSWWKVNIGIILLMIITFIFRQSLDSLKVHNIYLFCVPEMLVDVILALILFDRVLLAWIILLGGTMCLGVFGVISNMYIIYVLSTMPSEGNKQNDQEDDVRNEMLGEQNV